MTPPLCIGVPLRSAADEFVVSWTALLVDRANRELIGDTVIVAGSLVTAARIAIVRHFLAGKCRWLLMLDADMAFAPDIARRMMHATNPTTAPIVGGLAFTVQRDGMVRPTMYRLASEPSPHMEWVPDWVQGQIVEVDATGGACLLVHRRVFEKLDDGTHSPWFDDGTLEGERLGEDVTFCLRAREAGFPIVVDTSVTLGHVKPHAFGLAQWEGQRARARAIPTFVVVPRVADESIEVPGAASVIVVPNVDGAFPNIAAKFNAGTRAAAKTAAGYGHAQWNVLYLNDDVSLQSDTIEQLSGALRADASHAIAYPNVHGLGGSGYAYTRSTEMAGQTIAGYCFMMRGEDGEQFDERFQWHYCDADMEKRLIETGRRMVCVAGATIDHHRPMEATMANEYLNARARVDETAFARKWKLDPASLWWARHDAGTF